MRPSALDLTGGGGLAEGSPAHATHPILPMSPTRRYAQQELRSPMASNKQPQGHGAAQRASQQGEGEHVVVPWNISGSHLNTLLSHTRGKLGDFVMLDMSKLEVKLLREQQRLMEIEQQALMAQWAAPTRGASIARDVLEAQMAPSRSNSLAPTSRHGGASQRGGGAASRPQSTHGGAQYDDTAAWQDNAYSSAEDPHGYGGEEWHLPPLGGGGSAPASPGGGGGDEQRQPARPDIINSRSRRLVELVQQGQARMRPVGMYTGTGGAMASDGDAPPPPGNQGGGGDKGGLQQRQSVVFFGRGLGGRDSYGTSEQLSSATPSMRRASYARNSSPSFSDEVPMLPSAVGPFASSATQRQLQMNRQLSMNSLKGSALAAQALITLDRAERLLQRLREDGEGGDSRPGTSPEELAMFEQHLQMLKNSPSLLDASEAHGRRPSAADIARQESQRAKRMQAKVWTKGLAQGGMLKSVHTMSRRTSHRYGVAGPQSLAMAFVAGLQDSDEFSLVGAARSRLDMMQRYERLLDSNEERRAGDREAEYQLGLILLEHLLQELQQRVDNAAAAAAAATARGGAATGVPLPSLPTTLEVTKEEEGDEAGAGGLGAQEGAEGGEGGADGAEDADAAGSAGRFANEDKLTQLRMEYGPRVNVKLQNGKVVHVPQTPDGALYSGAFGRTNDFRKRARHQRAALIQHNPAAFQEEAAEVAEANYRALAERAHIRYQTARVAMEEPRLVQEFMKAVKYLQSDRPYFLPPVCAKQALRRPAQQVQRKAQPEWVVDGSVFEQRKKENEARDVYDTEKVKASQFLLDWSRVAAKSRFRRLVARDENGARLEESQEEAMLNELRVELGKYREHLRSIFAYYGNLSPKMRSEDALTIGMGTWLQFCTESKVVDNTQRGCSATDLQTVFVSVNYEEEKDSAEADANDDDAMMRFEFYEGVVRAAYNKFVEPGYTDNACDAVALFMEDMVLPNVPAEALLDPNDFRRTRFYTKEMDKLVTEYLPLLTGIHKVYRAKDHTKHFWIEHWAAFLDACRLMGAHTGLFKTDAKLIFFWSQAVVTDELKRRKRAVAITLFDLVEAVARLADVVSLPLEEELDAWMQAHPGEARAQRAKSGALEGALRQFSDAGAARNSSSGTAQNDEVFTGYASKLNEYFKLLSKDPQAQTRIRRRSCGLVSSRLRPLHEKFSLLMQYVLACMREAWGGRTIEDCARRMTKMANVMSGGIELS